MTTEQQERQVKEIIAEEIESLMTGIKQDFMESYERRGDNWMVAVVPDGMRAYGAFAELFDAKAPEMYRSMAHRLAEVRYGTEGIPESVSYEGVSPQDGASWEAVLPEGVTYKDFVGLYGEVAQELNMPGRCQKLIESIGR